MGVRTEPPRKASCASGDVGAQGVEGSGLIGDGNAAQPAAHAGIVAAVGQETIAKLEPELIAANTEAGAVAVLEQILLPPGTGQIYRALPVETLFGEVPGKEQHH